MTNICPIDGQGFEGRCGRRQCWFNGTRKHPTRCARICLGNKDEITASDIGYLFDISNRRASEVIEVGRSKIDAWIRVFEAIDGSSETLAHRCSHCGVGRVAAGTCLNRRRCDKRREASEKLVLNPAVSGHYMGLLPHQIYAVSALDTDVLERIDLRCLRRLHRGQKRLLEASAHHVTNSGNAQLGA